MSTAKLVRIALFSAILFVSQVALAFIPNCEVVSLLIIVLTLVYGKEMILTSIVFSMLECIVYGVGLWTIMYIYIWPVLVLITLFFKRWVKSYSVWAVISGCFGLLFGTLCTLVYIPLGWSYMISYWISGIPWDIWHGATNFMLMLVLGPVLARTMKGIQYGQRRS